MMSMTRMAIGAGMAAVASVSLGAGAASAVPRDTYDTTYQAAAVAGNWQKWDSYWTEKECNNHGYAGNNDGRWGNWTCRPGTGKEAYKFILYVEYKPGKGAPTGPTDEPPYIFAPPPTDNGDGDGAVDDSGAGGSPPVGGDSITR
jgi:hypothetical protein